jgi:hypothetical protein
MGGGADLQELANASEPQKKNLAALEPPAIF